MPQGTSFILRFIALLWLIKLYGIALFLMAIGFYRRDVKSILVSVVVILLYGGIVWGVLPLEPGVSWEFHLAGSFTGVGSASAFGRKR